MVLPNKVEESFLQLTPAGVAVHELLKEGVTNGLLQQKSVAKFLDKWVDISASKGTCYGEASAIMIADKKGGKGEEANIAARAHMIDAVAFQILDGLRVASLYSLACNAAFTKSKVQVEDRGQQKAVDSMKSVIKVQAGKKTIKKVGKLLEKDSKIAGKIERVKNEAATGGKKDTAKLKELTKKDEKTQKKSKKFNKELTRAFEKGSTVGVKAVPPHKMEGLQAFQKKVDELNRSLLEKQGGYKFMEHKRYTASESKQLKEKIKELYKDSAQGYAVRLCYQYKQGYGHAVSFSLNPRLSMYDAQEGMISMDNIDEMIKRVINKKAKVTDYEIEVFQHV